MTSAQRLELAKRAREFGVTLDDLQLDALARYAALLLEWNERINLTAVTDLDEVIERHFVDSLVLVPHLPADARVLDVGTGAGFPGAVLAIARPDLAVTCVDSVQKKIAFLSTLRRTLQLSIDPIAIRLEQLKADPFTAVVSRAALKPADWVRAAAPWVAPGGSFFVMLGLERPAISTPPDFESTLDFEYSIAGGTRRLLAFLRVPRGT
jgi:16S rRNA (guanine527-N7)-methyltransferase